MATSRLLKIASLLLACLTSFFDIGCNRSSNDEQAVFESHSHGHGPHGGHLIRLSENTDFEMEFTVDDQRRKIVIYIQERDTRNPYPLPIDRLDASFDAGGQSVDVIFTAEPRPGEPTGTSSRFSLSLDKIPQQLVVSNQFVLSVTCSFNGETITGSIHHNNDHEHAYNHD